MNEADRKYVVPKFRRARRPSALADGAQVVPPSADPRRRKQARRSRRSARLSAALQARLPVAVVEAKVTRRKLCFRRPWWFSTQFSTSMASRPRQGSDGRTTRHVKRNRDDRATAGAGAPARPCGILESRVMSASSTSLPPERCFTCRVHARPPERDRASGRDTRRRTAFRPRP